MTVILLVLVVLLSAVALASLVVTADRISRATAWRQIALERRWNHEHHHP